MSERSLVETEVEVCLIGNAEDDLIDGFLCLNESQKRALKEFMHKLYVMPATILMMCAGRDYSPLRESSYLEFTLGGGVSAIVYYLDKVANGIRQIGVWAVSFAVSIC